jgi:tetratricopeptide (TPR) repeat protein
MTVSKQQACTSTAIAGRGSPGLRTRLTAAAVLTLLAASAQAQQPAIFSPKNLPRLKQGLEAVYNLEHDRAIAEYQAMIREDPEDPLGYVFLAKTYWLKELVVKQELSIDRFAASDFFAESPRYTPEVDPEAERQFRETTDLAVEKARALLQRTPGDPRGLFLLGMAYQNLASFEASLNRAWWASFRAGSKCNRYHKELLDQYPKLYDAYLTAGVFNYVTGSLGWESRWLACLLGHCGAKERGREQLRVTAERSELFGDDARVLLALIYTRELRYQAAFDELSVLLKRHPQNYLVHLDMGGVALLMRRPDAALTIYQDVLRKVQERRDRYERLEPATVLNRLGAAFRQKGDLQAAIRHFEQALAQTDRSIHARVVASLELGKTYDVMGQRDRAERQYRQVLALEDFADSRGEARELLERPYREPRVR